MELRKKIVKSLLSLAFVIHLASAATHSLQYFYTAVTPGITSPEFTVVGLVDGEQFMKYDSDTAKMIAKTEWIKKVTADYWNNETQTSLTNQNIFKISLATVIKRFNYNKGVHTLQMMYGCELHDDGTKRGYMQYGYDGEDFLSLDLNTLTWIAAKPQAVITKNKWDVTESGAFATQAEHYLENTCIEWLQKYVSYGKATLERKVRPQVSLFQKDSYSLVVCHATGFFPRGMAMSWLKNGKKLKQGVEHRQALPNQDGSFQKKSILRVSAYELNKNEYSCVVQHNSLEKDMVLHVEKQKDHTIKYHEVPKPSGPSLSNVRLLVKITCLPLVLISFLVVMCLKMKKKFGETESGEEESDEEDSV